MQEYPPQATVPLPALQGATPAYPALQIPEDPACEVPLVPDTALLIFDALAEKHSSLLLPWQTRQDWSDDMKRDWVVPTHVPPKQVALTGYAGEA